MVQNSKIKSFEAENSITHRIVQDIKKKKLRFLQDKLQKRIGYIKNNNNKSYVVIFNKIFCFLEGDSQNSK